MLTREQVIEEIKIFLKSCLVMENKMFYSKSKTLSDILQGKKTDNLMKVGAEFLPLTPDGLDNLRKETNLNDKLDIEGGLYDITDEDLERVAKFIFANYYRQNRKYVKVHDGIREDDFRNVCKAILEEAARQEGTEIKPNFGSFATGGNMLVLADPKKIAFEKLQEKFNKQGLVLTRKNTLWYINITDRATFETIRQRVCGERVAPIASQAADQLSAVTLPTLGLMSDMKQQPEVVDIGEAIRKVLKDAKVDSQEHRLEVIADIRKILLHNGIKGGDYASYMYDIAKANKGDDKFQIQEFRNAAEALIEKLNYSNKRKAGF